MPRTMKKPIKIFITGFLLFLIGQIIWIYEETHLNFLINLGLILMISTGFYYLVRWMDKQ